MSNKSKKWWVMVGAGMSSFIGCIDFTIVNTALPTIQQSLDLSFSQLQWVMNIFMFMLPVFLVIGGRCGDIYGHRKTLYTAVIIFGIASLGAGMSDSITTLLIFRAIQGMGAALIFPNAAAVVLNAFPESEQGKAMGILYSIFGIGLAIGPVVGGILVWYLNWRWIFLVNVPIIMISFTICLSSVKESILDIKQTLDYAGVVLMMLGFGSLTAAIAEGNNFGWSSPLIITLFVVSVILIYFWTRHEMHSKSPTLNFKLFNNRNVIASILGSTVIGAFYCLGFFLMPLYLANVQHLSSLATGNMLMATSFLVAALSPLMGHLMDRYCVKYLIIIGLGFFAISAFMQAFFGLHTSYTYIIVSFIFFGAAWGMTGAPIMTALIQALPRSAGGVATATIWTTQNIGAVLALAIGTAVFQFIAHTKISADMNLHLFLNGYQAAMLLLCAMATIVFIITIFAMQNKKSEANNSVV